MTTSARPLRTGIVFAGGGAHGAYEAGVLSYLFENVYPRLEGFEFDVVAGTSVGAIHAGYLAATAHAAPSARAKALADIWTSMTLDHVLRVTPRDLVGVPLRALGIEQLIRREGGEGRGLLGGLVDLTPLEELVKQRIPWTHLHANVSRGRPGALAVSCTEVASGDLTIFMEGPLADPALWSRDPQTVAVKTRIDSRHVRASAAVPFLFPAVRVNDRWYIDGGLRVNTPLSPALRLGADKLVVIALRHPRAAGRECVAPTNAISQPAFLLGKLLNVLMLDQLENELDRLAMVNALVAGASRSDGTGCLERLNAAARAKRGVEYRNVEHVVIRPTGDIGAMAAQAYARRGETGASRGVLAFLLARAALFGVPEGQADLLSYIYFDASFTRELFSLGHEDARAKHDEILRVLRHEPTSAAPEHDAAA
jgi:NTE family protein